MKVITIGGKKAAGKSTTLQIIEAHWKDQGRSVVCASGNSTLAGIKQALSIKHVDVLIVEEIEESKRGVKIKDLEAIESGAIAYVTITN